jgi:hypothetical protein
VEVRIPGYQPISVIAPALNTDEQTLLDFHRKGWIEVVERRDTLYLSAAQRYRAKYILHLREAKHLNDDQVQTVLSIQQPPYSLAQVDEILRQHEGAHNPGDAVG